MERIGVWRLKKRINELRLEKSDSKDLLTMALKAPNASVAESYVSGVEKTLRTSFLEYLSDVLEEGGENCDLVIYYGNTGGRLVEAVFRADLDDNTSFEVDKVFHIERFLNMIVPKSKKYILMSLSSTSLVVGELHNEWKIAYEMTPDQFFSKNKALLQSKGIKQSNKEKILAYMLSNVASWGEGLLKSALDGVVIGLHPSMKSYVSLDDIDEKIRSETTFVGITKCDGESFFEIMEKGPKMMQDNLVVQEIKALNKYHAKIQEERYDDLKSSAKGLQATLKAIDSSSLACLIVDENFGAKRLTLIKKGTDEERVQVVLPGSYLPIYNESEESLHKEEDLLEWLIEISKKTKFALELISDKSEMGKDFIKETGGIAGLMMFKQDLSSP